MACQACCAGPSPVPANYRERAEGKGGLHFGTCSMQVHASRAALLASSRTPSRKFSSARSVTAMAVKRVLVPIGTGSEEMEAVITIDVLRRAGAEVTIASVESDLEVVCSRGVKLVADQVKNLNNSN